jgi:hypothetical protein
VNDQFHASAALAQKKENPANIGLVGPRTHQDTVKIRDKSLLLPGIEVQFSDRRERSLLSIPTEP